MSAERWKQVRAIFDEALELDAAQRASYLKTACAGDIELQAEVLDLLQSFDGPNDFLENPVAPALSLTEKVVDAMEGRRLGPYQLLRRVGSGGMGTVYAASRVDREYRKLVAVKLVKPGMGSEEILRRFRTERQVLASLDHPNIARLLDGGTTPDGLPYLVMEFVPGVPIDSYCETHDLSIPERLKLICHVCSAVQYAHQNLIVHRDIKPSNILVTPDGVPKLLDFGVAKLLRPEFSAQPIDLTRTLMGPLTPDYASPEQVAGDPITTASDVYSLGVVLYRVLTGEHPFHFRTKQPAEMERTIVQEQPRPPSAALRHRSAPEKLRKSVAGDLDVIVLMAIRKEPQRRYASVEQLAADIGRYLEGLPVRAQRDTVRYRLGKYARRHSKAVAATAFALVALVASSIISLYYAREASVARDRAERQFNNVRQLAHFVMFDFDTAIQAGATPARKVLIGKALDYLSQLSHDARDDARLQREIIQGYCKVGDVQGNLYGPNLGDAAGAKASYTKALAIAESVLARSPADSAAQQDAAVVKMKLGDLLSLGSARAEALDRYRQAEAVFEAQNDRRNLMALSRKLGLTQYQIGDLGASLRSYERYLKVAGEEFRGKDSYEARSAIAFGTERVGYIMARTGAVASGLDRMRSALRNYEHLARENPAARRDLATTLATIGDILFESGRTAEAAESYGRGLAASEMMLNEDPQNQQLQRDVTVALGRLADAQVKSGHVPDARIATLRALKMLKPMVDAPEASEYDLQQYCWILVTTPFKDLRDAATARHYAERLVALTGGKDARNMDLLARAHYAAGNVKDAVNTEMRALDLLPRDTTSDLRKELEANLTGFRLRTAR